MVVFDPDPAVLLLCAVIAARRVLSAIVDMRVNIEEVLAREAWITLLIPLSLSPRWGRYVLLVVSLFLVR